LIRNQVAAEDKVVDAALTTITAPLRERLRHHPKLRPEQPMGVLRARGDRARGVSWASAVACVRTAFAIREHRISAS
jgi:hypothetical protein